MQNTKVSFNGRRTNQYHRDSKIMRCYTCGKQIEYDTRKGSGRAAAQVLRFDMDGKEHVCK